MQLTSFMVNKMNVLMSMFIFLCLATVVSNNFAVAGPLTYSPDQWPRHWNVLMHKTRLQDRLNGYRANGRGSNQAPARSPVWGVAPAAKQKSRRSFRPEYNTNAHMRNYYGQNIYQGNYYSGFPAYGLANPYNSPLLVPGLMQGLTAPGIPFRAYPSPSVVGFPGTGYRW